MIDEKNEDEKRLLEDLNTMAEQFLYVDISQGTNNYLINDYYEKISSSAEENALLMALMIKVYANRSTGKLIGYQKANLIKTGLTSKGEVFVNVVIDELKLREELYENYFLAKDAIDQITIKLVEQKRELAYAKKQYSNPTFSEIEKQNALPVYGESFFKMAEYIEKNIKLLQNYYTKIANNLLLKNPTLGNALKIEIDNKIIECEKQFEIALGTDFLVKASQYAALTTFQEKEEIINHYIHRMKDFESSEATCLKKIVASFVKEATDEDIKESIIDSSDSESQELEKIIPAAQKNMPEKEFAFAIREQLIANFIFIKEKCAEAENHWQGEKDKDEAESSRLTVIKSINEKLKAVNDDEPSVESIFNVIKDVKEIYSQNEASFYKTRSSDNKKIFEWLKSFLNFFGAGKHINPEKSTSSHAKSVDRALNLRPK